MRRLVDFARLILPLAIIIIAGQRPVMAQTLRGLNETLNQIEPDVAQGMSNPSAASEAIDRLDQTEIDFARLAEGGKVDQEGLLETYQRL